MLLQQKEVILHDGRKAIVRGVMRDRFGRYLVFLCKKTFVHSNETFAYLNETFVHLLELKEVVGEVDIYVPFYWPAWKRYAYRLHYLSGDRGDLAIQMHDVSPLESRLVVPCVVRSIDDTADWYATLKSHDQQAYKKLTSTT